jgi:hypothetical protein
MDELTAAAKDSKCEDEYDDLHAATNSSCNNHVPLGQKDRMISP